MANLPAFKPIPVQSTLPKQKMPKGKGSGMPKGTAPRFGSNQGRFMTLSAYHGQ